MATSQSIGFIGTGTIGAPISERLLACENKLYVFDSNTHASEALVSRGATPASSLHEIAENCATCFLSLPNPDAVTTVVRGDRGLLGSAEALETIVDLSTNTVALSRTLATEASRIGITYLDAPVSGGKLAARNGTLAVMVGGDETAYLAIRPLLECFGKHIFYMGLAGSGTSAKLVNNAIFLSASVLIQEAFIMGAKAGLDADTLLSVLQQSSAAPLLKRAALFLSRDFHQEIFALDIAAKDLSAAVASAQDLGVAAPTVTAALQIYNDAMSQGLAKHDFFATAQVLESVAGIELSPLHNKGPG